MLISVGCLELPMFAKPILEIIEVLDYRKIEAGTPGDFNPSLERELAQRSDQRFIQSGPGEVVHR